MLLLIKPLKWLQVKELLGLRGFRPKTHVPGGSALLEARCEKMDLLHPSLDLTLEPKAPRRRRNTRGVLFVCFVGVFFRRI